MLCLEKPVNKTPAIHRWGLNRLQKISPSPAAGKSQGPRAHRGPSIVRRETGVFKNGIGTGRHTHTHIQKGEIRLVPHTTYEN